MIPEIRKINARRDNIVISCWRKAGFEYTVDFHHTYWYEAGVVGILQ